MRVGLLISLYPFIIKKNRNISKTGRSWFDLAYDKHTKFVNCKEKRKISIVTNLLTSRNMRLSLRKGFGYVIYDELPALALLS